MSASREECEIMKVNNLKLAVLVMGALCPPAFAATVSIPSSIDDGGLRTSSANYTMDGSVGGIGGISSAAPDTAKNGYIGQLYEVASMLVTVAPGSQLHTVGRCNRS